jgi:hypothetical protein
VEKVYSLYACDNDEKDGRPLMHRFGPFKNNLSKLHGLVDK